METLRLDRLGLHFLSTRFGDGPRPFSPRVVVPRKKRHDPARPNRNFQQHVSWTSITHTSAEISGSGTKNHMPHHLMHALFQHERQRSVAEKREKGKAPPPQLHTSVCRAVLVELSAVNSYDLSLLCSPDYFSSLPLSCTLSSERDSGQ